MTTTISCRTIDLDLALSAPVTIAQILEKHARSWNPRELPSILSPKSLMEGLNSVLKLKGEKPVASTINGSVFHPSYLAYLELCWSHHWTPVVTPDILWFTLLNELAVIVRENAESLRDLFTVSAEKTEIIVSSVHAPYISAQSLVTHLTEFVPTAVNDFLPTFSTSSDASRTAFCAAFCDIVSPYYNYSMNMCGLRQIMILGSQEDWTLLADSWRKLPQKLMAVSTRYTAQVQGILDTILTCEQREDTRRKFWSGIFKSEQCGSGHQTEISGWFSRLYRVQPVVRYASNYTPNIARVDYTNLDNGKKYTLLHGLFSSQLSDDGTAAPAFESIVLERPAA